MESDIFVWGTVSVLTLLVIYSGYHVVKAGLTYRSLSRDGKRNVRLAALQDVQEQNRPQIDRLLKRFSEIAEEKGVKNYEDMIKCKFAKDLEQIVAKVRESNTSPIGDEESVEKFVIARFVSYLNCVKNGSFIDPGVQWK